MRPVFLLDIVSNIKTSIDIMLTLSYNLYISIVHYVVYFGEFSVDQLIAADMNHDGMITNVDQVILARMIVEA